MAYGDFKDLNRRTAADKKLREKAFNPNLGGLFRVRFEVSRGVKLPPSPSLKLVRIM